MGRKGKEERGGSRRRLKPILKSTWMCWAWKHCTRQRWQLRKGMGTHCVSMLFSELRMSLFPLQTKEHWLPRMTGVYGTLQSRRNMQVSDEIAALSFKMKNKLNTNSLSIYKSFPAPKRCTIHSTMVSIWHLWILKFSPLIKIHLITLPTILLEVPFPNKYVNTVVNFMQHT